MKYLYLFFLLISCYGFGQSITSCQNCWVEYKSTAPADTADYCKLRLCPDGSICCFLPQDNDAYITHPGWQKLNEKRLQLYFEAPVYFSILKWTDHEVIIQSETDPKTIIYLKRSHNSK